MCANLCFLLVLFSELTLAIMFFYASNNRIPKKKIFYILLTHILATRLSWKMRTETHSIRLSYVADFSHAVCSWHKLLVFFWFLAVEPLQLLLLKDSRLKPREVTKKLMRKKDSFTAIFLYNWWQHMKFRRIRLNDHQGFFLSSFFRIGEIKSFFISLKTSFCLRFVNVEAAIETQIFWPTPQTERNKCDKSFI